MAKPLIEWRKVVISTTYFIFLLFSGCDKKVKEDNPKVLARHIPKPKVTVMKVEPKQVSYILDAVGSLEADEVQIYSKVNGVVSKLQFKEGDFVEAGKTVLIKVEPEFFKLELDKAKAQVEGAKAILKKAKIDYKSRLILYRKGYATYEEMLSFKTNVEQAKATLKFNMALYKLAKKNYKDSIITSPISGIIQSKSVSLGEFVRPGTLIATLVDNKTLRVKFSVHQAQAIRLYVGQKINFSLPSITDKTFTANIYHISQRAHEVTRSVECKANQIRIQNSKYTYPENLDIDSSLVGDSIKLLRPGYFVNVMIETSVHKNAIVLPPQAILPTENGFVLYALENGVARERKVETGLYTEDGQIEILSGVKAGDIIIVQGANIVKDGVEVDVSE